MAKFKRVTVTLRNEWEPELLQLKKDVFYNDTRAEMYRQLIQRGLESLKDESKGTDDRRQRESA